MKPGTFKAILLATVGGFIMSSLWYILFGNVLATAGSNAASGQVSPIATVLVELTRNLLLAGALAFLVGELPAKTVSQALILSLILWVGFPVILLAGSVFHEGVSPVVAAVHGGDWLLKITLATLIIRRYQAGFKSGT